MEQDIEENFLKIMFVFAKLIDIIVLSINFWYFSEDICDIFRSSSTLCVQKYVMNGAVIFGSI